MNSPLETPAAVRFPAIDPSTAVNISNYSLMNMTTNTDESSFIKTATFVAGTPITATDANGNSYIEFYTGQINLTFSAGLPSGSYQFIAHTHEAQYPGLADAADAFELTPQHFVGELGDVADRLVGAERETQDRRRVRIEPVDARLLDGLRQQRQDAVDLVAHFLSGDVGVLVEQEADHHLRDPLRRHGAELVDAADRVDGLFDLVGDFGFHLFRRGAWQAGGHHDGGEVDLRKAIEPKLGECKCADDGQRQRNDRGKDGTTNGDASEPLHDLISGNSYLTLTS